ncbi:MAG: hypothetical protein A3K03_00430 [Bdellovibrionales bacterium RIFOXYD1_FULL_44_7]|nr:MAG: hypothetical protein A3K03_00430 [Bdellovibrionales bacterium RIFOXYD1_FULL_44_7]
MKVKAISLFMLVFGSGCASLSTPVLKHETGETLGAGKFRVRGQIETSRIHPLATVDRKSTLSAAQENGVFQGGFLSVQGAAGVHAKVDAQLGAYYTMGGGGWRVGTKYKMLHKGNFASAVMAGYGRYSGKPSNQSYKTGGSSTDSSATTEATGSVEVSQMAAASHIDVSFPVSFRLSPTVALYSGANYYRSDTSGFSELQYVEDSSNDFGTNFGVKLTFGKIEADAEMAYVMISDSLSGGSRFLPYWGASIAFAL